MPNLCWFSVDKMLIIVDKINCTIYFSEVPE